MRLIKLNEESVQEILANIERTIRASFKVQLSDAEEFSARRWLMYLAPVGGELIGEKVGEEWYVRPKYEESPQIRSEESHTDG
jgi:hypothetical protein